MDKLLLISKDQSIYNRFAQNISYPIIKVATGTDGINVIKNEKIGCIIIDLSVADVKICELIQTLRKSVPDTIPIIIISDTFESGQTNQWLSLGATGLILKKYRGNQLADDIIFEIKHAILQTVNKSMQASDKSELEKFVYKNKKMQHLYFDMQKFANFAMTVLLIGESGVGKDCVAREIHNLSAQRDKPFVIIPVNSITESLIESELFGYVKGAFTGAESSKIGKFEAAQGGTIYIPEVSTLPDLIQLKLLHFIQYRTVTPLGQNPSKPEIQLNVKIVFATNVNLETLVEQNKIRRDFYHRINVVRLTIPPLRERKEDIAPLADYFSNLYSNRLYNKDIKIHPDVIDAFMRYDWPGNVRELENVIECSLIYAADKYSPDNIPPILGIEYFSEFINSRLRNAIVKEHANSYTSLSYESAQREFKEKYFGELLKATNWNIPKAAEIAKITPQGLRKILKQLQINYPNKQSLLPIGIYYLEKLMFPTFEYSVFLL